MTSEIPELFSLTDLPETIFPDIEDMLCEIYSGTLYIFFYKATFLYAEKLYLYAGDGYIDFSPCSSLEIAFNDTSLAEQYPSIDAAENILRSMSTIEMIRFRKHVLALSFRTDENRTGVMTISVQRMYFNDHDKHRVVTLCLE